jgi:hypothetical protein
MVGRAGLATQGPWLIYDVHVFPEQSNFAGVAHCPVVGLHATFAPQFVAVERVGSSVHLPLVLFCGMVIETPGSTVGAVEQAKTLGQLVGAAKQVFFAGSHPLAHFVTCTGSRLAASGVQV